MHSFSFSQQNKHQIVIIRKQFQIFQMQKQWKTAEKHDQKIEKKIEKTIQTLYDTRKIYKKFIKIMMIIIIYDTMPSYPQLQFHVFS